LSWTFDPGQEAFDQPNLKQPHFEGVAGVAPVWTVYLPPGFRANPAEKGAGPPASAAGRDLRRAAAQLRLRTLLVEPLRTGARETLLESLGGVQDRFHGYCREAEHRLATADGPVPDKGPERQTLEEWLG